MMRLKLNRFKTSIVALTIASALAIGSAPAFAREPHGRVNVYISPGDVSDWLNLYFQYRNYREFEKDRREWRKHMKRHDRYLRRHHDYGPYYPYYGAPYWSYRY